MIWSGKSWVLKKVLLILVFRLFCQASTWSRSAALNRQVSISRKAPVVYGPRDVVMARCFRIEFLADQVFVFLGDNRSISSPSASLISGTSS